MKTALVATDFSAESEAARRRAAHIARECGLGGSLMHVLPASLPADFHLHASSQAQTALEFAAQEMKRDGLRFEACLASGDIVVEIVKASRQHDLVVAGARGEDVLLDFGLGRTSARLVRRCDRPVLIVKRPPDGPYRRVLVAVDFSEPALAATALGAQVAPQAELVLVHAYEVEFESRLRLAGTTEERIHGYRRQAHEKAMAEMSAFAGRLGQPRPQKRIVMRGFPPRVILDVAEQSRAELVVIGKHAAGVIERALVGSVSLRVLDEAKCDVLVVPELVS